MFFIFEEIILINFSLKGPKLYALLIFLVFSIPNFTLAQDFLKILDLKTKNSESKMDTEKVKFIRELTGNYSTNKKTYSVSDKLNTKAIYNLIKVDFEFEHRGKIETKGKY